MEARVDEIAEKIYRLSTFVPGTASEMSAQCWKHQRGDK